MNRRELIYSGEEIVSDILVDVNWDEVKYQREKVLEKSDCGFYPIKHQLKNGQIIVNFYEICLKIILMLIQQLMHGIHTLYRSDSVCLNQNLIKSLGTK